MLTNKNINFIPLGEKILVQRLINLEEEVKGGIIIPDSAKEKSQKAVVIALGKSYLKGSVLDFSIGDSVLINKYSGIELVINNNSYVLVKKDDILGLITNN